MKTLLWILGAVALVLVIAGAANYSTEVAFDYVAGTTAAVSLFWVGLVVAAAIVVAGVAGWVAGAAGQAAARGKLERELESTYRRLRDCEARASRAPAREIGVVTAIAPAPDESATAITTAPDEAQTVVAEAPAETQTVVAEAPAETQTVVTEAPVETQTVVTEAPVEADGETPSQRDGSS